METERPRALRIRPMLAAVIPLPSEEVTPPVTKTYFDMGRAPPGVFRMLSKIAPGRESKRPPRRCRGGHAGGALGLSSQSLPIRKVACPGEPLVVARERIDGPHLAGARAQQDPGAVGGPGGPELGVAVRDARTDVPKGARAVRGDQRQPCFGWDICRVRLVDPARDEEPLPIWREVRKALLDAWV